MKKFDCRDHHTRLARHQREVLKMDKSQFPEDGMLCPICSHVCRTPEDQRFVDSCLLFLFYFILFYLYKELINQIIFNIFKKNYNLLS